MSELTKKPRTQRQSTVPVIQMPASLKGLDLFQDSRDWELFSLADIISAYGFDAVNPEVGVSKNGYPGVQFGKAGRTTTVIFSVDSAELVSPGDSIDDLVDEGLKFVVSEKTNADGSVDRRLKAVLPSGQKVDTSGWKKVAK